MINISLYQLWLKTIEIIQQNVAKQEKIHFLNILHKELYLFISFSLINLFLIQHYEQRSKSPPQSGEEEHKDW